MKEEKTMEKLRKVKFGKRKLSKKHILCISVIVGVVVIPLLYSYFYLGAFWDPYSRLETLPVAVVNLDEGALINEENRNLGQEICEELADNDSLNFILTDEADAKAGTEGEKYYATITIPKEFSSNIASASTTDKQTAIITYSPNEKRNYLASQILSRAVLEIEKTVRSNVDSEITQQLVDQLNEIPAQMSELQDGLTQLSDGGDALYDGTSKLSTGAFALADGTSQFRDGFKEYAAGVTTVKDGTLALNSGIATLDNGISALLVGATTLTTTTENITDIHTGALSLASGADLFYGYILQYTSGVDSLIASANATSTFMNNLVASPAWTSLLSTYSTNASSKAVVDYVSAASANKAATTASLASLTAASTNLKTAAAQIRTGSADLSNGTTSLSDLKDALIQIQAGLATAKEGSTQLVLGSQSLYDGLAELTTASATLSSATDSMAGGAYDLAAGSSALLDGTSTLTEGIDEMQSGVDTSITDMNEDLPALDGLADYVANPVTIETENLTSVPNYGTAFAPYFMSLSLWVGGLIIFVGIYYDPDNKFEILSRESTHRVARSFIYLSIGFVQAIVLGILLLYGLGLQVANLPLYFVSCCLVSLVFISMIQFFMVFLKDLGKFISMLLLILQLTSCGGTFPMETVPGLFNVLYPFMPMTYSVGLFKNAISGVDVSSTLYNGGILTGILVVFMLMTLVGSIARRKKEEKDAELNNHNGSILPHAV